MLSSLTVTANSVSKKFEGFKPFLGWPWQVLRWEIKYISKIISSTKHQMIALLVLRHKKCVSQVILFRIPLNYKLEQSFRWTWFQMWQFCPLTAGAHHQHHQASWSLGQFRKTFNSSIFIWGSHSSSSIKTLQSWTILSPTFLLHFNFISFVSERNPVK